MTTTGDFHDTCANIYEEMALVLPHEDPRRSQYLGLALIHRLKELECADTRAE